MPCTYRNINVHALIPSGDTWVADFALCVVYLTAAFNNHAIHDKVKTQRLTFVNMKSSLLPQLREAMLRGALKSDATHVLLLDSDMSFPKDTLHRLLNHGKDFVAANYVTKQIPAEPISRDVAGELIFTDPDSTGLVECGHTGMGVVLIRLDAIRKAGLKSPFFPINWVEEGQTYAGEDVAFCAKLREAGIKLWIDQDLSQQITHVGDLQYKHAFAGEVVQEEVA